jgi:hypothetical protein
MQSRRRLRQENSLVSRFASLKNGACGFTYGGANALRGSRWRLARRVFGIEVWIIRLFGYGDALRNINQYPSGRPVTLRGGGQRGED